MYKGTIQCSATFAKMVGFKYTKSKKGKGRLIKYFECEVTQDQLDLMRKQWKRWTVDIEWELRKPVEEVYGIKNGDVRASLLNFDRYFFNKWEDLEHKSVLKTWEEYNGLYVTNREKYLHECYVGSKTHIRDDGTTYMTSKGYLGESETRNSYDEARLEEYLEILNGIKGKITTLKSL